MAETPGFAKVQGMGYNPEQVDALLELAKAQYESPDQILLRASDLRGLRIDLVSGGYAIAQVDDVGLSVCASECDCIDARAACVVHCLGGCRKVNRVGCGS